MHSHMRVKFGDLVEGLVADITDVVPDAAVLLHVLAQRRVAPERLVALRAFERLLTGMQAEVNL